MKPPAETVVGSYPDASFAGFEKAPCTEVRQTTGLGKFLNAVRPDTAYPVVRRDPYLSISRLKESANRVVCLFAGDSK